MIFVTVGHQMPFDRLVRGVDEWAGRRRRHDVFAQVGDSRYATFHMESVRSMTPEEFRSRVAEADAVVAHAGTGTILTALQLGVPVLIMPRVAAKMETRNDHQISTSTRFRDIDGVYVAMDEYELPAMLDRLGDLRSGDPISPYASEELVHALRDFIFRDKPRRRT